MYNVQVISRCANIKNSEYYGAKFCMPIHFRAHSKKNTICSAFINHMHVVKP